MRQRTAGGQFRPDERTIAERFRAFVGDGPPHPTRPALGPCQLWTGAINRYGYGHFYLEPRRVVRVHKFALTLAQGPPPDDERIFALHSCDRRACCADAHLSWGTRRQNLLDQYARFRRAPKRLELHGQQQARA